MDYTTIEQSKKLVKLGLDMKTHDMFYEQEIGRKTDMPYYVVKVGKSVAIEQNLFSYRNELTIPCWSVTALLELMPTPTLSRIDDEKKNDPSLWYCNSIQFGEDFFDHQGGYHDNPIDACIEAIEWLIENGHIERKEL